MANANTYTDIVVRQKGYYVEYATGHSREECLKQFGLRPTTKVPHVHYSYGHTQWEVTGLGHALKWSGDQKPPDPIRTEYNTKPGDVTHTRT
jgi:hypothetical protein